MRGFPYCNNISKLLFAMVAATAIFIGTNASAAQYRQSFNKAKALYINRYYQSALAEFCKLADECNNLKNKEKTDLIEVEGYRILCLVALEMPSSASETALYEKRFPYSPMLGKIKFNMAVKHFDNADYAACMALLESIDKRDLSKEEREEYTFRKGFCQMRMGNSRDAINTFTAIIHGNGSKFRYPALYYCGYLHYINEEFAKAVPLFEQSCNEPSFSILSRYHLLESKFMLKDYDYVIKNGASLYEEIEINYKSKVARIISEAYYAVNDTAHAKYYFELYTLSGSNLSKADNFYAGMIAYTLNNHISATDAFSKIASSTDSLGQSAAYHLGQSYIQLKNKYEAQKAFKLASESNFDKTIKEDAFFNYAKLSFDINRDVKPFEEYLKSYSYTDSNWDEIHSYMATQFLMNGDYADAIESLKKIKTPSAATTANLQKASFFRAIQLIRNGSYSKALPYLQESVKRGEYNPQLKHLAEFWMAECHYRKDEFIKCEQILAALQSNSRFKNTAEYPTSVYNMGYSQFKRGDYQEAAATFGKYLALEQSQRPYSHEANTRLADCCFMMKDYLKAAELYEKSAIRDNWQDLYAPLQGAIAYGLLNDNNRKISLLEEITKSTHRNSPLYTSAIYELGRTLVQNVEDEKAEIVLKKLINNPKDSTFYYKALLEMGMINANRQHYDTALDYYKTIVAQKPVSEEGQSALAGIENIYQSQNKPQEFLNWLDQAGLSATKTESEKESMLFNAAEQIFLGENYTDALNSLNSFIKKYPDGARAPQAYFYIAESYNKLGKPEKAADNYYKVMESGIGAFSEIATLNYGKLSYQLERYKEAADAFETLDKIAQLENNKTEAKTGLIKSYFMCRNYRQTLIETEAVLSSQSKEGKELKELAEYYKAKSHIALGEREKALGLLKKMAKDPTTSNGAEAAYLLIADAYDAGNFESVENQTFALSDSGTPQAYWLAKSFIVLGDSYAERGNLEQAEATFNSIRENYSPDQQDDIADLLKIRLNKLAQMKKQ